MQSLNASNHIFGLDINYKLKYTHRKYSIWKEKKICEFIKFCKIRDASLLNGDTVNALRKTSLKERVEIDCLGYREICLNILAAKA